jgi:hypothetical protein
MTANITITEVAMSSPPAAPPAPQTARLLTIINNGGPRGSKSGPFSVTFNELRSDIDTSGRVGGRDLLYLQNAFGSVSGDSNYNINADLSGDGRVDGADVSLLAIWHGHKFF